MAVGVFAQRPDTLEAKHYIPTGIRVGTDLISLGKIPWSDQFDGWEAAADVDFDRYYLTAEVGRWEKNFVGDRQRYTNDGSYYRIGADVNFLLKDPDKNMFFMGLRYAHSKFNEQLTYSTTEPVFSNIDRTVTNNGMKAGWGEVTLGLRVKVWKELWMGYTARMKVAPTVGTSGEFEVYDIPGFGLASKTVYWGFNYQLYWRFRKCR